MQTTFNTPATPVPSLSSSAMLVELSISYWSGRKMDKSVSKEIETAKHADRGVASVSKRLLGNCAELDAVQKFQANVRNFHYAATMPWSDSGLRIVPTARYFDYHKQITALQAEFFKLVDAFLAEYEWARAQAQVKLGDMFRPDDYPTVEKLKEKFRFNVNYIPLPDAGDWRVDLGNEAVEQLRAQYEAAYAKQVEGAMKDIWKRLFDTLTVLSRQLSDADADGKKPKMYQSVFDRALEIIDLMEDCNLTGDPQMQMAQRKLAQTFRGVSLEAVKDDPALKAETKRSVDEIIAALPSLDM